MNTIEIINKAVLTEQVLLHGSPKVIDEIHPHYADDEMAVCATPYSEIAIFMAIINSCRPGNCGFKSTITSKKCFVEFMICDRIIASLLSKEVVGYVYALDSRGFSLWRGFEYRSYEPLYSLQRFTVKKENLPFYPILGQNTYTVTLKREMAAMFN
ncbi:MAG: hypothetical protein V4478_00890 [Patescibacteria group bacterium]